MKDDTSVQVIIFNVPYLAYLTILTRKFFETAFRSLSNVQDKKIVRIFLVACRPFFVFFHCYYRGKYEGAISTKSGFGLSTTTQYNTEVA